MDPYSPSLKNARNILQFKKIKQLTLFRIGLFGADHGWWGRGVRLSKKGRSP